LARSWSWSGQSGFYYLTAWISRHLAPYIGLEFALRLPTLVAFTAAVFLLYRLGRYLMNPNAGILAALAFVCIPEVSFAAVDARPYALGLAVLIASMLCFFKWLDTGKLLFGILYAISAAMVIYCHYLFGLALIAQFIYGLHHWRKLVALWAVAGTLCLPLAGQLLHFYQTRRSHSFDATPDARAFFVAIAPPILAGSLLLTIFASKRAAELRHRICWPYLFTWLVFPPAVLLAVSSLTDTKLFVSRYYLSCTPAAALLSGYAISRLSAQRFASALLTASLAIGIWRAGPLHGNEDWRGVMSTVNALVSGADTVLIATGFVEGTSGEINSARLHDVLFSPQQVYPLKQFRCLPYAFEQTAVPGDLTGSRRVFLITRRSTFFGLRTGMQYESLLSQRLIGYRSRELGNLVGVSLLVFER
jgi:4-amino-4-deoxy-L-arabinose transferase-like glycosyltransferase